MTELTEAGDSVAGEKLVAAGRKMSRALVIHGTAQHRAIRVVIWGLPARCYVDKPYRRTQKG